METVSGDMTDKRESREQSVYGVWVDMSTRPREALGPLFGRISLPLRGPFDALWQESCLFVRRDLEAFSRFHLDLPGGQISFTFRLTDSLAEVQGVLQRLELFVELAHPPSTSPAAAAHEGPRVRG